MRNAALAALMLLVCAVALADTVVLKDGRTVKGKVFAETDEEIVIKTMEGQIVTIPKEQIESRKEDDNVPEVKPLPETDGKEDPPDTEPADEPEKDPEDPKPTKKCKTCAGTGKATCRGCRGKSKGSVLCDHCKASPGTATCQICAGDGVKVDMIRNPCRKHLARGCPDCGGRGYVTDEVRTPCRYCGQTGKMSCRACRGKAKGSCRRCGCTGLDPEQKCRKCRGAGVVAVED